jgi:hypothetical protein
MTSHHTVRPQALLLGFVLASTLATSAARASDAVATLLPQGPGTLLVACLTGASTNTYAPGLKNMPQDVTRHSMDILPLCVNLPGRPLITSATSENTGLSRGLSCTDLIKPLSASESVYTWGDGGSSTVLFTQTRVEGQGATTLLISTGSVTAGRYQHAVATRTLAYVNEELDKGCLSETGLTRTDGSSTLVLALPN